MSDYRELNKVRTMDEQAEFVMSFVDDSEHYRDDMRDIWDEVDDNYLVRPAFDATSLGTNFPLDANLAHTFSPRNRTAAILKDPETHQEVMTLLARIVLDLFPVSASFTSARAIGFEDIRASQAVGQLNEHAFRLKGHYWNRIMQLLYALLRGTGVGRWNWEYQEEARNVRSFQIDPFTGELISSTTTQMVPTWDDPKFKAIDSRDFYPDHSKELLSEMPLAAEHFRMTASDALRQAERGVFDSAATKRAIDARFQALMSAKNTDSAADASPDIVEHPDYMELDVYEAVGETPFRGASDDPNAEDGIYRRVITVMNGETVRSRPWARRMPFTEIKIIPRPGSFWGLAVGELVRYDQDFADTAKMMLADAAVRMAHPPLIYDKNAEVDLAKLRRFNPRVPIGASRVDAVSTMRYEPRLGELFTTYQGVKAQMRDASSALDSLQGQAGPNREAATTSSLRFQAAQSRPELFSAVCEREWLPEDGRIVFELYREFLRDDSELVRRIGASQAPASLLDINADFDIEFMGSRQTNRIQKIEAFREVNAAAASNPIAAQLVPWVMLYRKWFKDMGAEEIADMVGNPQEVQNNLALSMMAGRTQSNNNGEAQGAAPSGLLPAQTAGVLG